MRTNLFLLILVSYFSLTLVLKSEDIKSIGAEATANSPVAVVKKVFKDVDYRKSSQQSDWQKASVGLILNDGNEVKTGSKSLALILFTDGTGLLRVRENSILHIYGEKKQQRLDKNTFIQKGLISFDVNKLSENEEFKFTTPTVVASIRGTSGFLEYTEDSTFTMSLDSGSAHLSFLGPQGGEGILQEGNTVVITNDGNFQFRAQSPEDINKANDSKKTTIKKVIIKTQRGNIEIEYYSSEE
ncbi:MAG: FecR domain-containing protein [Melioribacter sp.]|nr:FecR domain-containing protein [Melioribacter sp.]